MTEQTLRQLLRELAQDLAPDGVNLCPAIRARISLKNVKQPIVRRPDWRVLVSGIAAAVIALTVVLQILPGGKASIEPIQGPVSLQQVSLAEAQQRIPFAIHRPSLLPKGLTLSGVLPGRCSATTWAAFSPNPGSGWT